MKRIFPILLITLVSCCSRNNEVSAQTETTNGSGTIVLYYSYTGSIQAIVDEIQILKNVDVVEVQPVEKNVKYEANNYAIGSALISTIRNNPDAAESYPAVEAVSIDFSKYNNVIIATPLWWSNMAAPMQSFLFEHGSELAGKNIGLIVSSASSGISSVVTDAKRLIPNGNFSDESLWINDENRNSMPNLVNEWIEQLNFTYIMKEKLYITINDNTLTATLYDNTSSQALVAALKEAPITYEAHNYGDFEKVGDLGQSFPTNDEQITTAPGDLILYQGSNLCIYYDKNYWKFTRLGKIDELSQAELKSVLGTENCSITLSLSKIEISDDVVNTAVPTIKSSNSNDSQIYDLQGRKIDSLGKGQIYIQNGEKRVKQF